MLMKLPMSSFKLANNSGLFEVCYEFIFGTLYSGC